MAKIPFSIDYRPQIKSGEYKVVTGDDRPVRIISWDKKVFGGRIEIVGLVPTSQGDTETVQLYCPDGTLAASGWNEKLKLFLITPEQELTEFERTIKELVLAIDEGELQELGVFEEENLGAWAVKKAAELLELAKKELCKNCVSSIEGYSKGRQDALEEMKERDKAWHYEGPSIPIFFPPCYYGGPCTNMHHDCINCPRQSVIGINTTSGTSTLKAENKED